MASSCGAAVVATLAAAPDGPAPEQTATTSAAAVGRGEGSAHEVPEVAEAARAAEGLNVAIRRLKAEQQELRTKRKQVAAELRNASRRASRLKKRARQLTDADLLEVLRMRQPTPVPSGDVATEI